MDMNKDKMVESILNLTLEILYRLTGEGYAIVKKTSSDHCRVPVSEGWEGNLSPITGSLPPLRTHGDINDQKILELIYKMIELLTGEVPIRCQDVTVYFSMEEWEYLEGHKDRYKDVMMEVLQPRTSPDDLTRNLDEQEHLITSDFKEEDFSITQVTYEDHAIFPDKASVVHNRDLSSDPIKLVLSSHLSQVIKENEILRQVVQNQRSQGKKTFKCSECGRCFNDKSNLIKHERFHTGEKPYSCLQCGKGFADRSNLVSHQKSHTGEKPYSCSDCGKCFTRKSNLENHKRIHKGEKPFSCSECGKCFTDPSSLVMHHRSHTGVKPYSCPECGRCFIRKSVLVVHRIRKHKE